MPMWAPLLMLTSWKRTLPRRCGCVGHTETSSLGTSERRPSPPKPGTVEETVQAAVLLAFEDNLRDLARGLGVEQTEGKEN
jgi:hypothetical protein